MKYSLLRSDEYRLMSWKNGLGTTCEVRREPADEADTFIWRVSIADIKEKSSFSKFSGLMRIINTLEGEGMRLKVDGTLTRSLLKYDPFIFSGDRVVESELLDGPIRDFNLIYNPELCAARLQWLELGRPQTFCSQAKTMLIFAVGEVAVDAGEFSLSLSSHDSVLLSNDHAALTRVKLSSREAAEESFCCLIEIDRRS